MRLLLRAFRCRHPLTAVQAQCLAGAAARTREHAVFGQDPPSEVYIRNHFGLAPVVFLHPDLPLRRMRSDDRPALDQRSPAPGN